MHQRMPKKNVHYAREAVIKINARENYFLENQFSNILYAPKTTTKIPPTISLPHLLPSPPLLLYLVPFPFIPLNKKKFCN